MLIESDFIYVYSFDFSVRHAIRWRGNWPRRNCRTASTTGSWTFSRIMPTALSTPDKYQQSPSSRPAPIKARRGPASYVVTAADLHPVHDLNRIFKFADYTSGRAGRRYRHVPRRDWPYTNVGCWQQPKAKPQQDEGNRLLIASGGGASATAAASGQWACPVLCKILLKSILKIQDEDTFEKYLEDTR